MKNAFIISVHSFSDIITNSSTDIFACKTKQSVKAVKELLSEMCKASGCGRVDSILTVKEGTAKEFWHQCADYLVHRCSTFKHFLEYFGSSTGDDKIIIVCGTDDNSIPYWLQTFIEYDLGGYRVHMG